MSRVAVAVAAVTLVRLVVAADTPMAPDETYYWVWSHALAPGYLDHPPMVALWISAGTALLGQGALGVRLLGPLAAAVASWMLLDTGRVLFPGTKAGVVAVMLLNASLLLGVGTVIMTPDSPLLFFWTAAFWAVARIAAGGSGLWWLAAGVFGGLALDSKFTALLLWIGVTCWVVLVPGVRPWLRRWQPWAASAIGLGLFAPVFVWNARHAWAGFAKQGGRVEEWRPTRAAQYLTELVVGQIGLATPLVWALCMAGLLAAMQRAWRLRDPGWSLLVALSLPPILVFVQHAFGDRVQGNWPAIIYPSLAIAAGARVIATGPPPGSSPWSDWFRMRGRLPSPVLPDILPRRGWIGASLLGFALTALVYLQAMTGLIPLPSRFDPIATRLLGWDGLANQIDASRQAAAAVFVAADGYALASELAWWLPPGIEVIGTDARWRLTTLRAASVAGEPGLLVRDVRRADPPDPERWTNVERIATASRPNPSDPGFAVYRVVALNNAAAGVVLPRR